MDKKGMVKVCNLTSGSTGWYAIHALYDIQKEVDFFQVDRPDEADVIIVSGDIVEADFLNGKMYLNCSEDLNLKQLAPKDDPNGLKPDETLVDLLRRINNGKQRGIYMS